MCRTLKRYITPHGVLPSGISSIVLSFFMSKVVPNLFSVYGISVLDYLYLFRCDFSDDLALSIGYASHKDHPDASINELKKLSDKIMYEEKTKYYQETGYERRGKR